MRRLLAYIGAVSLVPGMSPIHLELASRGLEYDRGSAATSTDQMIEWSNNPFYIPSCPAEGRDHRHIRPHHSRQCNHCHQNIVETTAFDARLGVLAKSIHDIALSLSLFPY